MLVNINKRCIDRKNSFYEKQIQKNYIFRFNDNAKESSENYNIFFTFKKIRSPIT
jgi:hypothetical protein